MSNIDHESVFQIAGVCKGMELRDYFAAKFAIAVHAHGSALILADEANFNSNYQNQIAIEAYALADAMMKQRLEGDK